MASTFSNNLRIELIAVGEQANTWGGTTNNNLGTLLEQAITGGVSIDVTAGNVTLTALDGASDQSRPMVIIATGTPGATRTITAPAKGKVYIVYNHSNASLNFIASGGGGVTLIAEAKKFIYCDSYNFYEAINALTVTSGTIDGTTIGATTATTGRFTTVNASGQVTSTVTTGTAPFVVASTTAVANLTSSNVTTNANLTGGVTSVGNAATVVTNANLTGAVTSVGNATLLGSFTSAQLATALTNETGSGSAVFSISPTFTGTVNTAALTAAGAVTITGAFALRGSYGAGADTDSFAAGDRALDSNTTGFDNTAVGVDALTANTIGYVNTAFGNKALYRTIDGTDNTAVGHNALYNNTYGSYNTAVGKSALYNSSNSHNTAVGYTALYYNTLGSSNVGVGSQALNSNTTGYNNVAVGDYALPDNTTGISNTAVGVTTASGLTTGSYNQVLGDNIILGPSSTGRIGIGSSFTHPINNWVYIGNGTNRIACSYTTTATWAFTSDERLKNVIGKDVLGLNFINDLEPVTYRWKPSNEIPKELTSHYAEKNVQDTNIVMHGLIAQNVKAALDKAGVDTFTGWGEDEDGTQRLGMADLITPMINAIKELTARLEALEGKL